MDSNTLLDEGNPARLNPRSLLASPLAPENAGGKATSHSLRASNRHGGDMAGELPNSQFLGDGRSGRRNHDEESGNDS
ncbi:hypothetical protein IH992_26210 [Candidatus Poribacteria bacterium]|nr:hypothetical protein [Candidatus Poribacteria bacterium]